MSDPLADIRQQQAEDAAALQALEACVDLPDVEAGEDDPLAELRRLPDDDQPDWRRPS